ncbi:MAG TPA: hypothetical protein VFZ61_10630, partial [Polyangiales bacterium]
MEQLGRLGVRRRAFAAALSAGLFCACGSGDEGRTSSFDAALPALDATPQDGSVSAEAGSPLADASSTAPALDASAAADASSPADARVFDARLPDGGMLPALCGRNADDPVRDLFCNPDEPAITGLRQLQHRLGFDVVPKDIPDDVAVMRMPDPDAQLDQVVFMGHSTALSGHIVSPINPRVLLFGPNLFMAFQRGVQQVELAALDRNDYAVNLYLVTFRQACNQRPEGCKPGDLYTLSVERDWQDVRIEDAEDLKNTPADCRQCHQRVRGKPMLLMRELQGPWSHFFSDKTDPSVIAFQEAKKNEIYGGVPYWAMGHAAGFNLQSRVDVAQPLEFKPIIVRELEAHDPAMGPRRSPTWDKAYQAFKRGEQLALPYFEALVTDPQKQARLTDAYKRYRAGELPAAQLPDLGDIYPDDPQARAEIGLQIEPNATPVDALIQACAPCHNDRLDQTISRARFNISLGRMSRAELDEAVRRIEQPAGSAGVMPPPESRELDAAGRARLLAYL